MKCSIMLVLLAAMSAPSFSAQSETGPGGFSWTPCGWGGGGFYWSAVFHPSKDGVLYMGGDCAGVYKSLDHGRTWRLINNGLANYAVYSLAVDNQHPETVYAATEGGLCKSLDGGEHWALLPRSGRGELNITGQRERSIRSIAVDGSDGNVVYAASPGGKLYKSTNGGVAWKVAWEKADEPQDANILRVQFGKVNGQYFGGMWLSLTFPAEAKAEECTGFGFTFKGGGVVPQNAFLTLTLAGGAKYRSRDLREIFRDEQWRDMIWSAGDFVLDPDYAKKNPDKAQGLPASPNWALVTRMDFTCVGPLMHEAPVGRFGKVYFAFPASGGQKDKALLSTVRDFTADKAVQTYGNIHIGAAQGGVVYSVVVAPRNSSLILAATADSGLLRSTDAGRTWRALNTPRQASSVAVAWGDSNIIYGSFFKDGVWKSTDCGETWQCVSQSFAAGSSVIEAVVSPANPLNVYAICTTGWNGSFYLSSDGGHTWKESSQLAVDHEGNPTSGQGGESKMTRLSRPTNLTINPLNPQELFLSANWRPCLSEDGGLTWKERDRGADISCISDIRFYGNKTYVTAMDEGTLVSEDGGKAWRQLWPRKYGEDFSGHNWRIAVNDVGGAERIIATCSPWWDKYCARVILSGDGGKTFRVSTTGLPDYVVRPNTMWGAGHPRALAVDERNPQTVYLGIDGDPEAGKCGGGVFKSTDGGNTWKQLVDQPGSRRMFYGLAVDPTDSKRIFWGACGSKGGLYRSEDAGATWNHVFANEFWIFNVLVTPSGVVYCPGRNLWRSMDHGSTWLQITRFTGDRVIVGLEVNPHDERTMWISTVTWDSSSNGAVYKTSDGGATWQEITGNLPYAKPLILRYNPLTDELWAGGVGLFKLKQ